MCQQQSNGVDCGLYAVYNAYSLLKGDDISSQKIDERKLRSHFLKCVGNGIFSQPPITDAITVYCDEKIINVETFCVCKMAWAWYHNKNKGLNMAQCGRWAHVRCKKSQVTSQIAYVWYIVHLLVHWIAGSVDRWICGSIGSLDL